MRSTLILPVLLLILAGTALTGCATLSTFPAPTPRGPVDGIRITTTSDATMLFHDNRWSLGWSGVTGHATVNEGTAAAYEADTTLSYGDITSAAASGRGNTMTQFLETILGVVLVIGLAALILYAAFRATDR
jgi:hypothetical protein